MCIFIIYAGGDGYGVKNRNANDDELFECREAFKSMENSVKDGDKTLQWSDKSNS